MHKILNVTTSFRHAIVYLIGEAQSNGFSLVKTSLEDAERAIDEELSIRGLLQDGQVKKTSNQAGN